MYELNINEDKTITVLDFEGSVISTSTFTNEDVLPDDIKTKLSALKLVTPPDILAEIGQRVSEVTFWIID